MEQQITMIVGIEANGHGSSGGEEMPAIELILYDKIDIAKAVNVEVISLQDAPTGYAEFDSGVAKKFVIDPHGMLV